MAGGKHSGEVIIITGGSSGLGLNIARYFASEGAHIAIFDIIAARGEAAQKQLKVNFPGSTISFHTVDVRSWEQQAAAFKVVEAIQGRIDVVFANAGVAVDTFLVPTDGEEPVKPDLMTLDVNLTGCVYTTHLGVHYLRKNKGQHKGSIVCTASDAGLYGFAVAPIYGASKHGVVGLVRSVAGTLALEGIRVNGLAPNIVESNLSDKSIQDAHILTPVETVVAAAKELVENPSHSGKIAECSGNDFQFRDQVDMVDDVTIANFKTWWTMATGSQLNVDENGTPVLGEKTY